MTGITVSKTVSANKLKRFLDERLEKYNNPSFVKNDPVCIPHLFSKKQDVEIAGFFAAIFAWGNRTTIIQKSRDLIERMDMAPYQFVLHSSKEDLKKLQHFRHRTFNDTDLLYFIEFFKHHYQKHSSLENAFSDWMKPGDVDVENSLRGFYDYFFSLEHVPGRTMKHIATPARRSSCKRLNMFLRWMVRNDKCGVDLGIWNQIKPAQLICPVDVHVARVANRFGLLDRKQPDWQAAVELTEKLRRFDPADPVKYDFSLFGLGVLERY